jgi:hypothetical protein
MLAAKPYSRDINDEHYLDIFGCILGHLSSFGDFETGEFGPSKPVWTTKSR